MRILKINLQALRSLRREEKNLNGIRRGKELGEERKVCSEY